MLSIAEVQRYLRKPKLVELTGEYARFWMDHIPRESTPEQLADLLDGIAERFAEYRPFMMGDVGLYTAVRPTTNGAVEPGSERDSLEKLQRERRPGPPVRMAGCGLRPGPACAERETVSIRFDLEWDADALKALIAHGVKTSLRLGEDCKDLVDRRLFGARPRGYVRWCLEMALARRRGQGGGLLSPGTP